MPNYTSPLARSLGWDLGECGARYNRFVKGQAHRIERQFARQELAFLTDDTVTETADEARMAILASITDTADSWGEIDDDDRFEWAPECPLDRMESMREDDELRAWELECDRLAALDADIEALAWAEAGFGGEFEPEDVQWGFIVSDRPLGGMGMGNERARDARGRFVSA